MAAIPAPHRAADGGHRKVLLLAVALALLVVLHARAAPVPPPADTAPHNEHRCGFDELEARTVGTRVSGISRVVPPALSLRNVDAVATAAADTPASWQPIRIRVFTEDLEDTNKFCTRAGQVRPDFEGGRSTCTGDDVLTDHKKKVLKELLIPSAIKLHEERLNVQRVDGSIVVGPSISTDGICGQFTVPSSHTTTGVSDADFVLYMSAGPTSGTSIAWATTCQNFADTGRPSVGVSNVSPKYISADPTTVRVITHELLHALGFSINSFLSRGMYTTRGLRGKGRSPVLVSSNVVAKAREQYGCPSLRYMELEDEGGDGTVYSHWKRRSAKDELMAGISGVGHYTALTIAAMEDMGFYKGNYTNAEPMSYGRNAGCTLSTSKCVIDGVSQFPEMFCASSDNAMTCTSDHTALGSCGVYQYKSDLPPYFQYFSNPTYGGADPLMDYCPYIEEYSNSNCSTDTGILLGSTYGVNSRCLDVPSGFAYGGRTSPVLLAICAEVQCNSPTYSVKVAGASSFTACTPGATLSLPHLSPSFSSGSLTCPRYDDVCTGLVKATEYKESATRGTTPTDGTQNMSVTTTAAPRNSSGPSSSAHGDDNASTKQPKGRNVATGLSSSVACGGLLLAMLFSAVLAA
ncbi:putative mitochondrial major surface protease gp63, putative,leishmanolysin [Leptomonas pyrrhocoris]|uniref:Leishmanolysin n=1 Tax=Leptomonas pyrrhocoris TaxID=157538 RepID=A0A0M9G1G8_LEPPY|nr:putative mitochondrial major surface protease gp63, putative,leishmanolysin [Leptomonas pyrrhocoris]XP_015658687.1 putative mitochondrial major surface protease gp63, putative,leishmanolysin [Leptomonas pyrrhocoris]XP_015658688.1 putative mitochondrial major surface protease gp63, putative,leishmanolysin [Leptomonas pyrrhocoris]KPA80247.1 putative mitochondrial major surface protease gp63, putative,leishmanolysin [Leptomonas pyrrhocoris]KPA80248.1 putative mitochondrial major surface proteas|eukprot:XP_015658686.1 putative mitochondrial major surface protease gp63, putative,leishmanolysin [Leptomonas pyrrhocoris]